MMKSAAWRKATLAAAGLVALCMVSGCSEEATQSGLDASAGSAGAVGVDAAGADADATDARPDVDATVAPDSPQPDAKPEAAPEGGADVSAEADAGTDAEADQDGGLVDAADAADGAEAKDAGSEAGLALCEGPLCSQCHGTSGSLNCAPPIDTKGHTAPTDPGVGAHQAHLGPGALNPLVPSRTVLCADCHAVPTLANMTAGGHMNGKPDVAFSGPVAGKAVKGAPAAAYSATTHTCSNVYCHKLSTQSGGIGTEPDFAKPGSAVCGTCHALPPTAHLPADFKACGNCHGAVVHYDDVAHKLVWDNPSLHVNGVVDVQAACDGCHGGAAGNFVSSAPPKDLGSPAGTSSTDPQVGAHQAHLAQTGAQMSSVTQIKHKIIACSECHLVPTSISDPGHIDPQGLPAELKFGPLASQGQTPLPSIDKTNPQAPTCKNVYCHGGVLCDGYKKTPQWNAGAAESMCGTCHGVPPAETRGTDGVCGGTQGMKHPPNLALTDCGNCHPATMKKTGATTWEFVNDGACHVNGKVSTASCDN